MSANDPGTFYCSLLFFDLFFPFFVVFFLQLFKVLPVLPGQEEAAGSSAVTNGWGQIHIHPSAQDFVSIGFVFRTCLNTSS